MAVNNPVASEGLVITGLFTNRANGGGWIRFKTRNSVGDYVPASVLTWFSLTPFGPAAVADRYDLPFGEVGENVATLAANSVLLVQTQGTEEGATKGMVDLEVEHAPDGTYYIMASAGGQVISVEVTITGN